MLKKSALTLDTVYEVRSDRPLSNGIEKLSGTGGMVILQAISPSHFNRGICVSLFKVLK